MLEKLNALVLRKEDLETQLGEPSVYADAEKLRAINRELKEIEPVVETFRAWQQAERDRLSAQELLHDADFRDLAQEELERAKAEQARLQDELRRLLLPKDPNDSRNVIMELRAVSEERRALCLPTLCFGCIPCTPRAETINWILSV